VRSSEQPCACLRVAPPPEALRRAGASAKAGRHLSLWNFRDELPWKRSRSPASLVTHPSKDPPLRGAEKTTRVGSSPVNPYRRTLFDIEL
jgi:hypothetical protein